MGLEYKICTKTIMDTSDSGISFNEFGESDYYTNFVTHILPSWDNTKKITDDLFKIAEKIKYEGKKRDFDCIIGVSGGLDSSYLLYVAKEIMGLRPLAFHVDAGWNSEKAVSNIEKLIHHLKVDLYTDVINWEEMKDLQLAFFNAQIPDQDCQDIAFFSALYRFAKNNKIKYVLTGANYSTECCREPEEWGAYPGIDKTLILDIHKKFGKKELKTFPLIDILNYKIYYKYFLGMQVVKPLNYIQYKKEDAENLLHEKFGWQKFNHKHQESIFTRFLEDFWFPKKFGFDRRRAHFSSLILTEQMTRDEAMKRIEKPEYSEEFLLSEFEFVAQKLDISVEDFKKIFNGKNKTYHNYKNKKRIIDFGARAMRSIGFEKRLFR